MALFNTSNSYGSVAKFLHWLIFLFILGMITFGYFLPSIPKEYQGMAYNLHKLDGLLVLLLMLLRLLWRLVNVQPELPSTMKLWERTAARVVHLSLYAVIIAMPLAGWIGASAAGKPPHLGSLAISFPIEQSKDIAISAFSAHNTLAILIIVLVSVHVLAAFYHLLLKRDDVFARMLPESWQG